MNDIVEGKRKDDPAVDRFEWVPVPKKVRVVFAGETVAESDETMLLRDGGGPPVYYFPHRDVRRDLLVSTGQASVAGPLGQASYWTVKVNGRLSENAAWNYHTPTPDFPALSDYIAFAWDRLDSWFEEDEEVFVHARDPFKRIDVTESSRHVRVVVAGEVVAETRRPVMLFEPGLPVRYYVPKADVRLDLLASSQRVTRCPYKGEAYYYSVVTDDGTTPDIAWYYRYPACGVQRIANMLSFYQERCEAFFVDGELRMRTRRCWVS